MDTDDWMWETPKLSDDWRRTYMRIECKFDALEELFATNSANGSNAVQGSDNGPTALPSAAAHGESSPKIGMSIAPHNPRALPPV